MDNRLFILSFYLCTEVGGVTKTVTSIKGLTWIGNRSFEIYILHSMVKYVLLKFDATVVTYCVFIATTLLLAESAYYMRNNILLKQK